MSTVWLDGRLLDVAEARISPFDHGLLVGDGVFETLRVYEGTPFAWHRHYVRLRHSATGLGLECPDDEQLHDAALAVLDADGRRDGRLRITVTGGPSPLGSERGESRPTVLVAAGELRPWPGRETLVTVPWPRNERGATAGLKTISYAENVRALALAQARGAGEALFLNTRGEVCEATGSNVFAVRAGTVLTPPADTGCLLGVTRALLLELAVELGIEAHERALSPGELAGADEAFLTSTTREVQAIGRLDDTAWPSAPGPVTSRLATAFRALVASDLDP